jgi:glycosyltransferase involved in cell wall biosynthesis
VVFSSQSLQITPSREMIVIDSKPAYPPRPKPKQKTKPNPGPRPGGGPQRGSAMAAGYRPPRPKMEAPDGPSLVLDYSSLYARDPISGRGRPVAADAGRPLRVVHVGPVLNRGGAEQWLVELVRFLDPSRVRIERAIATWPDAIDPQFVADLPIPHEHGGADQVRQVAADCDILMCWGVPVDELLGDVRPPLCVFLAHGDGSYTRTLLEASARSVDHVIAVSERVARLFAGLNLPTTVIYNGVDAGRLARTCTRDQARAALGFGPGDFVVGYVGRFAPEKRPHLILEAVAGLPAHFKVLLVGWGPLLPTLLETANRLIPGRFAFATAHGYLGDYYEALDAFCTLGVEEGFSLAMLEAMHCRRPIVATPVGVVPELVVDRVNGLVVAPAADALREAVSRLERFPHWAAGMAGEAHAWAERHGHAARMARDYEDLLGRLWAERPARPATPSTNGHGAKSNGRESARRRKTAAR